MVKPQDTVAAQTTQLMMLYFAHVGNDEMPSDGWNWNRQSRCNDSNTSVSSLLSYRLRTWCLSGENAENTMKIML